MRSLRAYVVDSGICLYCPGARGLPSMPEQEVWMQWIGKLSPIILEGTFLKKWSK